MRKSQMYQMMRVAEEPRTRALENNISLLVDGKSEEGRHKIYQAAKDKCIRNFERELDLLPQGAPGGYSPWWKWW